MREAGALVDNRRNLMFGQLNISKMLHSLLITSATAASLVSAPQLSQARSLPARGGSSGYFADAGCWNPYGPAMTNVCSATKYWYIPLSIDPSPSTGAPPGYDYLSGVTVTAQGAGPSNNVGCLAQGWDAGRNWIFSSGWKYLPSFGAATSLPPLTLLVPSGGTAMLDCDVAPNGQVIAVTW